MNLLIATAKEEGNIKHYYNTMLSKIALRPAASTYIRQISRRPVPNVSLAMRQRSPRCVAIPSSFATSASHQSSLDRVAAPIVWPNEGPGVNYAFNWQLNADGVTPTNELAFRITKQLDLTIAKLDPTCKSAVQKEIKASSTKKIQASLLEAGTDAMPFDTFDANIRDTRDALSEAPALYCPEGLAPGSDVGVRVITNSGALASACAAYLERAPRIVTKEMCSQPVTVYVYRSAGEDDVDESFSLSSFSSYAIEEHEDEDGIAVATVGIFSIGKVEMELLRYVVAAVDICVKGLQTENDAE